MTMFVTSILFSFDSLENAVAPNRPLFDRWEEIKYQPEKQLKTAKTENFLFGGKPFQDLKGICSERDLLYHHSN